MERNDDPGVYGESKVEQVQGSKLEDVDEVAFLKEAMGTFAMLFQDALAGMSEAIHVAAEKSAADAVEFIGDWLNGRDGADERSVEDFDRWVGRGRP